MASLRSPSLRNLYHSSATSTPKRLPGSRKPLPRPFDGRNQVPKRSLQTTRSRNAPKDNSPIDYAFMPKYEIMEPKQPEIMRIPLLPNNFFPPRRSEAHQEAIESVIRPEISTVSADSTHIASPSAMSEVTDNHAIELDPYDLTSKVTAAAARMAGMPVEKLKEPGAVQEIWGGFLDDLLGSKKMARA